jgi:sodium-dependent dicarboxylate transporter 2/3/5
MTTGERNALVAFAVAIGLWLTPDLAVLALGPDHAVAQWVSAHVTLAVGALLAAFLLFVLPAPERPGGRVLQWEDAAGIDWGTIILFGGGIALGRALDHTGLAASIGVEVVRLAGTESLWALTAIGIAGAIFLSEIGSNTASASVLVPVVIGMAQSAGVNPIPPVLGVAIGASLGFMLPVSTPPNAIVFGSGRVPASEMARAGIIVDVAGFVVTWTCLRLLLPPLGLA